MSAAQRKVADFRAYSPERRDRIGNAMFGAMLTELRDENGVVVLPVAEIMDAMALLCGVMISTSPDAGVKSKVRQLCEQHAKTIATRVDQSRGLDLTGLFNGGVVGDEAFQ